MILQFLCVCSFFFFNFTLESDEMGSATGQGEGKDFELKGESGLCRMCVRTKVEKERKKKRPTQPVVAVVRVILRHEAFLFSSLRHQSLFSALGWRSRVAECVLDRGRAGVSAPLGFHPFRHCFVKIICLLILQEGWSRGDYNAVPLQVKPIPSFFFWNCNLSTILNLNRHCEFYHNLILILTYELFKNLYRIGDSHRMGDPGFRFPGHVPRHRQSRKEPACYTRHCTLG